jgi:predicted HTH transcriptional regulator
MTAMFRVFVSSVQKELEDERLIVQNLVSTDPFLSTHCTAVLYEHEPASPTKALEGCIEALDACQVYLLIVGVEYGTPVNDLSITHAEYRRAKSKGLPVLAFIRGERHVKREVGTVALLAELDADGPKYKRFGNVIDLQREVRAALVKLLKDRFGIAPTSDENETASQTIEATSPFESRPLDRVRWQDLDHDVVRRLLAAAEGRKGADLSDDDLLAGAKMRGLVWRKTIDTWVDGDGTGLGDGTGFGGGGQQKLPDEHYATAAGILLLARDPSAVFPQCRILADAYRGAEADGAPRDHEDIRAPMPVAVDRALAFVDRNTRHPMRVVGLILESKRGKVRLLRPDELPAAWDPTTDARLTTWEIVHHLIRALASGGEPAAAELVAKLGAKAEVARDLAYRLYTLCERKKRTAEALAYNGLVQSWPEIARLAREGGQPKPEQTALFGETEE